MNQLKQEITLLSGIVRAIFHFGLGSSCLLLFALLL